MKSPPMVPSAQQRAREVFEDAIVEAPLDVFNDRDGNWSYHISILLGELVDNARAESFAAGFAKALEMLRDGESVFGRRWDQV